MSVIATFSVPAADFALGATVTSNPGIRVRLERVIPLGSSFVPYFWASDDSIDSIEAELTADGDIESFEVVDSANGEALVRVNWAATIDGVLAAIVENNATILEGVGENDAWQLQLRFDDHDALTSFYRDCADRGIRLDLQTVHNPGLPGSLQLEGKLTDQQRETLHIALEEGYFDVPRRINLVELADRLGISDSAVSQRIRRGVAAVIGDLPLIADERDREE